MLLLAAAATACTRAQIDAWVAAHAAADAPTTAATPVAPVDNRVPVGDGHIYRGSDPSLMCTPPATDGIAIPCIDVIDVCIVDGNGNFTTRWMPEHYSCDASSATWRDVCITEPPTEWPFYGYTPELCATA